MHKLSWTKNDLELSSRVLLLAFHPSNCAGSLCGSAICRTEEATPLNPAWLVARGPVIVRVPVQQRREDPLNET